MQSRKPTMKPDMKPTAPVAAPPSTPAPHDPVDRSTLPGADRSPSRGDASRPAGPSLPHDRDQQTAATNPEPDAQMRRAARDLKQGQVDTDLRATPGLDAERRGDLVDGGERGAASPRR